MGLTGDARFRDQVFLVHRQTSLRFAAETCIDFAPEGGRPTAGLSYRHDRETQYCLRAGWDPACGGIRLGVLVFDHTGLSLPLGADEPVLFPGPVRLRLEVDRSSVRFFWAQDSLGWEPVGPGLDAEGDPDDQACVGLACPDRGGGGDPAEYSLFLYETFE